MAKDSRCTPRGRQRARIEDLRAELEVLSKGQMIAGGLADCPPDIEERFLEHVLLFERAELRPLDERLIARGIALPAPESLNDTQLTAKLWEVIHGLADLNVFLSSTDHLSDRALYAELWGDLLREPTEVLPAELDFACHIDLVGSGSEEDIHLYLTFYADEADRAWWASSWPDDPLPARQTPPFDRDRHLPMRR